MPFEIPAELMVSVSGVRGRVGETMTPEVVVAFASAFGAFAREAAGGERARVVLGRDSRPTGPMLARAAAAALQSVGCDVIDIGLVPTPTALFAVRHHRAHGAIVMSASHNPVEWNALKLASAAGMFLDAEEGARMREYLTDRPLPFTAWDAIGDVVTDADAAARHVDAVLGLPYLDTEALRRRRFRVALDVVNGAGAVVLPRLLEALGCDVVGVHMEPHGRFERVAEPVAENLGDLGRLVRETGADIGLATDPDADRLSLVDNTGRAIGEDFTLALAAMLVLRHRRGPVVTNLSTSRVVEDVALEADVPFVRTPVGEINVARRMQAEGAVIGGEGNGGVILPDLHLTRDSAVAAALVLQQLLEAGEPLDRIVAGRRSYVIVKDKLPRGESALERTYEILETELGAPEVDRQDGLRLAWPDRLEWVHIRPSGTEPILRIIAEAPEAAAAQRLIGLARRALPAASAKAT